MYQLDSLLCLPFVFWFWLHAKLQAWHHQRHAQVLDKIQGRTFLVTGGTSGLGLEMVRQLLQGSAKRIIVASRSALDVNWPVLLKADYRESVIIPVEYNAEHATWGDFKQLFNELPKDAYAFLNAGVSPNDAQFIQVMRVNFLGPALLTLWLLEQGTAGIIYTGSFTALMFTPGGMSYTLAKLLYRLFALFLCLFGYPLCYASVGVSNTGIWDSLTTASPKMKELMQLVGTQPKTVVQNMLIALFRKKWLCLPTADSLLGELPFVLGSAFFYAWLSKLGAPYASQENWNWKQKLLYSFGAWLARQFPERRYSAPTAP